MAYKRGKKTKIAKYIDIDGNQIVNLKNWKAKHPRSVYFDSKFEYDCYKILVNHIGKTHIDYNPDSILLYDSFRDYTNIKDGKLQTTSIRKCEYTPDFIIDCPDGYRVYVDSKGFFFKDARLRYKIFQNEIIKDNPNAISVIVSSLEEMHSLCRIIKENHFEDSDKKVKKVDL